MDEIHASDVIDWTKRDYVFTPQDGGLKGSVVAWGKSPRMDDVLALRNGDKASCYRVTGLHFPMAADTDVFTAYLEFIPGRDIKP